MVSLAQGQEYDNGKFEEVTEMTQSVMWIQ